MTAPFVISMKIAGDSSSAVSATGALRRELNELNKQIVQTSAGAGSNLQGRLDAMFGIGSSNSAGRGADIAAYGAELDRLRAKYNPLFSVIRQYRSELADIRDANRLGAISEDEMAEAIGRRRTATLAAIQALKGSGTTTSSGNQSGNGFQTANIAAQFQDVLVSGSMPGANALTIALQQGTQLSAALGPQGLKGTVTSLGAAFMSLISPVSLVTVGVIAAGVAGAQWLGTMIPKVKSADEALKEHADLVDRIKRSYGEALAASKQYASESQAVLSALSRQSLAVLQASARAERENVNNFSSTLFADSDGIFRENWKVKAQFAPFTDAIETLRQQMAAGKPDFEAFYASIDQTVDADQSLRKVGDELITSTVAARDLAQAIAQSTANASVLKDVVIATHAQLAALPQTVGAGEAQFVVDSLSEGQKAAQAHQIELDAINAKSPAQLADIARRRTALELDGQAITEALRKQKIDEAGALAYAQASKGLVDADRNRLRALNDNVAAQQLALDVIGMSVGETERLTFARQNLAAAEAEAAQNGTTVSAAYRAEVERLAASYGKLQEAIALKKLQGDLQFDRDQLFRTPIEQTVASTLRPIFADDLTSSQALFAANQIRVNEQLKEMNEIGGEITSGFLSTFKSELLAGTNLFAALGNAGVSALDKIADKALDMASDGLWNMIFGAVFGGSSFGSLGNDVGSGASFSGVQAFLKSATGNAAGTANWRGGLTVANENGRGEIFDLPNGTRIIPHDVSMEMARSGGGGGNFTFAPVSHFSVQGGQADFSTFQAMLDERDRQLNEQFEARVAAYIANPNRRAA